MLTALITAFSILWGLFMAGCVAYSALKVAQVVMNHFEGS